MTEEEYKQLEELLSKLQLEFPGVRYCIIPGHIHDGYHIALYSRVTGIPFKTADGPTIEATVKALNET